MRKCWAHVPSDRPRFCEIRQDLETLCGTELWTFSVDSSVCCTELCLLEIKARGHEWLLRHHDDDCVLTTTASWRRLRLDDGWLIAGPVYIHIYIAFTVFVVVEVFASYWNLHKASENVESYRAHQLLWILRIRTPVQAAGRGDQGGCAGGRRIWNRGKKR
jgi:hypothetical protein